MGDSQELGIAQTCGDVSDCPGACHPSERRVDRGDGASLWRRTGNAQRVRFRLPARADNHHRTVAKVATGPKANMTHTLRTTAKRWGIKLCVSAPIPLVFFALGGAFLYFESNMADGRFWFVVAMIVLYG